MFGTYFFESLTQTIGSDGEVQIRGENSRTDFGFDSGLDGNADTGLEFSTQSGLRLDTAFSSQDWSIGNSSLSTVTEQFNYSRPGIQISTEESQWQWNSGPVTEDLVGQEATLIASDDGTGIVGDSVPSVGMNREVSTFELAGPVGSFSVSVERMTTNATPTLNLGAPPVGMSSQSTSFEWSTGSISGDLQINELLVDNSSPMPALPVDNQPVVCMQNQWMESSIENSLSLEFGSSRADSTGQQLPGLSMTQTETSVSFGPQQMNLNSQSRDLAIGFAQFDVPKFGFEQSQSSMDLTLAIA